MLISPLNGIRNPPAECLKFKFTMQEVKGPNFDVEGLNIKVEGLKTESMC